MIITRHIINKDIIFQDFGPRTKYSRYNFDTLSKRIDLYKNFLLENGAKPGHSVVIGYNPSKDQTALYFAVCELGMTVIISDFHPLARSNIDILDTKTKMILPIDYFFEYKSTTLKGQRIKELCGRYVPMSEIDAYKNYKENDTILATEDTILLRATSSGTTKTPKLIEYRHNFLYDMSKRNSSMYHGTVGLLFNLNHGSSVATYFIPALMSPDTKLFANCFDSLIIDKDGKFNYSGIAHNIIIGLDHFMIPYAHQLIDIISLYESKRTTYYTLTSITDDMINLKNNYKDIITFFGANETGGPFLWNKASFSNFESDVYYMVDDFYKFDSIDPLTLTRDGSYSKRTTNDVFVEKNGGFKYMGRSDLIRINGREITKGYDKILSELNVHGKIIYDTLQHKIYLALWDDFDEKNLTHNDAIDAVDNAIKEISDGFHSISKAQVLNHGTFVGGVKLDNELLRVYFREQVDNLN